jgi:hypothetical protein
MGCRSVGGSVEPSSWGRIGLLACLVLAEIARRGRAPDECNGPPTLPLRNPLFGFHDVPQDIVDAGQVTFTL